MTVYTDFIAAARGRKSWGKGTNSVDAVITYLYDLITTSPGSTLALENVISGTTLSSSVDVEPTSVDNVYAIEMTTSGKHLRFPATGTANNLFDGQYVIVSNVGSTHSFDVQNTAGTVLVTVPAGRTVSVYCSGDGTSNGSYVVSKTWLEADTSPKLGGTLDCNSNGIDMGDQQLSRPYIKDYAEALTAANSSTAYTIDLTNGNGFDITLTGNCTFTFSNPPASGRLGGFTLFLTQDGTGSRTVTWPGSVKWATESGAPTLSTAAAAVDILTFVTKDGGSTWYGCIGGLAFA